MLSAAFCGPYVSGPEALCAKVIFFSAYHTVAHALLHTPAYTQTHTHTQKETTNFPLITPSSTAFYSLTTCTDTRKHSPAAAASA